MKKIGQGRTAEIFQWDENRILKLFNHGTKMDDVKREFEINRDLAKQKMPVPDVFDLIEYNNRLGIIYEQINGQTLTKLISSKPWKILNEARRFAKIHRKFQSKISFEIPRFKVKLMRNIKTSNILDINLKNSLFKYIETLPDDEILCHCDFHPDNIMISDGKMLVIDWMTGAKGHPISDVARTSVILKFAVIHEEKSYIEKKIINLLRNKFYLEYIKHYMKLSNIKIQDIEQWELPIAAARLSEDISNLEKDILLDYVERRVENIS
ncbi:aminoglycoside phosphotransferase family protein [Maledivibacter halophilus]|uniref:TIGR02172 family protein n=1 Tax=Maledivibacter halophilus TaxID=36842 RepID=A0A1T5LDA8_9FIRM|nr:aminoglycoside phosphotransferase family protein [Maledivibacter halophilus]SKC73844.1 TIGR02172 family protein [Maledivibacter halophilus]